MPYEYPDHLCVTPGHKHVACGSPWLNGRCKTCGKPTPIGWEQPKAPPKRRPNKGKETVVRIDQTVGKPTRDLHHTGIDDTPCKRDPWLWDFDRSITERERIERRKAAKAGCDACPFNKACLKFAQSARVELEPGAVIAGHLVDPDRASLTPIAEDGTLIAPEESAA